MAKSFVSSGQTSNGLVVTSGNELDVLSGGVAISSTVNAGAILAVSSGGSATGTVANGGNGTEIVYAGGVAVSSIVNSFGIEILSGGTERGAVVNGGTLTVSSGGVASGVTLAFVPTTSSVLIISAGGTAINVTGTTGPVFVNSGGALLGFATTGQTGSVTISSGGQATGVSLAFANEIVSAGGSATGTMVSSGSRDIVFGTARDAVVSSGGQQLVTQGGLAVGTTVGSSGLLTIDSGGTAQGVAVTAGGTIMDSGTLVYSGGGSVVFGGTLTGTGALVVSGGAQLVMSGGDGFAGVTTVAGGTLELTSATAGGTGAIAFTPGTTGTLLIDAATPSRTISGFAPGAQIVLGSRPASVTFNAVTHTATLSTGGVLTFDPTATAFSYNASTGAITACFAEGTRIATPSGAIRVEALQIGDSVCLASGGTAPVVWLGHRSIACTRHPRPWDIMPVRVRAHAFGRGRPRRDVRLSPDHAVFCDGHLIPIRYLLNGTTITQESVRHIVYWHVELPAHAVLLAEGLESESYLDTGNRAAFAEGGDVRSLHPDFARAIWAQNACAALATEGPVVALVRNRLAVQAGKLGWSDSDDPAMSLVVQGQSVKVERQGDFAHFSLPAEAMRAELRSRSFVPAELDMAPDGRRLGLAIVALSFDGMALPLDNPRLAAGWHVPEPGLRWTDGAAVIDVDGVRQMTLGLAPLGRYVVAPLPVTRDGKAAPRAGAL